MTTKFSTNERDLLVEALVDAHESKDRDAAVGVLKTITQHRDAPGFPGVASDGLTPEDDAVDVAIDASVSCEFDTEIEEVDLSGVTIDADTEVTGISASVNEDGVTVDIAHDDFANSEEHTVTIPAGAVKNTSGIKNKTAISWSFTTIAL